MKDLAYWKGRHLDAKDAYRVTRTHEYRKAAIYAFNKVRELEKKVFKK